GLAGSALESVDIFLTRDIPDLKTERDLINYSVSELAIPEKIARKLSSFMVGVRSIGCLGISGPRSGKCVAVLCIDSKEPGVFTQNRQDAILLVAQLLADLMDYKR